jgi:UDP-2-acetamido-3-amino-2,3-dideoxy-glucuronate N-acetyltransferase
MSVDPSARVHATAIVETGATIGARTSVWDHVHVRTGARIGRDCIVGEKTYVAGDVVIGDLCKVNAVVYLCAGVTIEDGVMIAAHTVFTNDLLPRATDPAVTALRTSAVTDKTLRTRVGRGATIGANATIGPGVTIGGFAMVGMGGNPARLAAIVCACGEVLARAAEGNVSDGDYGCVCGRSLRWPTEQA